MPEINISTQLATEWAHHILMWIGFGTLVGLTAKAVMPGRDPGGTVVTLLLGMVGTVIGCGTAMLVTQGQKVLPISPIGFAVGTGGAFILLLFYRLLAGRLLPGAAGAHHHRPHYRGSRKQQPHTTIINND
jgi:uncharacterized membrane protein YeaQ/YmgE (transglycosylase-associated protein family)